MEVILVEIRDSMTFIPAMVIRLDPRDETERYLLGRAGYGMTRTDQSGYIILCKLDGDKLAAQHDPYEWAHTGRTMQVAHDWLLKHWPEIDTGAVIDVQFILGETAQPKQSERLTVPV